ncbi:hypothetical protein [Streptomyces sp. NPDC047042]|uniref:hypothetical protein n=1 Tax=Streptomyces sp. NPDC047042 TaxID=3154807 RepID=UPI0033FC8C46
MHGLERPRPVSAVVVEAMNSAQEWTALEPDGTRPSTELAIRDDSTVVGYGPDGISSRVTGTTKALGHLLRRTIAPLDISACSELRLSLRSNRRAGTGGGPFFLELSLGSAGSPLTDPGNTWHRLLPVRAPHRWETVRMAIDDLDTAVSGALTQIQLRCVDATAPLTAHLDDMVAVRPQLLADTDHALLARLSGITVAAGPVGVAIRAAGQPLPDAPALDVVHFDTQFAAERALDGQRVVAHTDGGARLADYGDPFDLDYAISPVAQDRADQAALIEAVLDRLAPLDELAVNGERLPVELVRLAGTDRIGGAPGEVPVLVFRVGARRTATGGGPVQVVSGVRIEPHQWEAL